MKPHVWEQIDNTVIEVPDFITKVMHRHETPVYLCRGCDQKVTVPGGIPPEQMADALGISEDCIQHGLRKILDA